MAVLAGCKRLGAAGTQWREAGLLRPWGCLQSRWGAEGTLVQEGSLSKACPHSQIPMKALEVTSDVPPICKRGNQLGWGSHSLEELGSLAVLGTVRDSES